VPVYSAEIEDWHDEVRSSRPPIGFLDIRILALLDQQPFHPVDSIAEAASVSHSIILSHLRKSLRMTFFWFPLDPARVNDQLATDSVSNLSKVVVHSQGSQEK
jgi:hypothetical protein